MRKWLPILLVASLIFITGRTLAQQATDEGFVIVRCTVTISVEVLDPDATIYFGTGTEPQRYIIGAGAGLDYVSTSSITVRNNSSGAICNWLLRVKEIQRSQDTNWPVSSWTTDDRWTLGTSPGVHQCVLYAVFATSRPATSEFVSNDDELTTTSASWVHGSRFDPATGTPSFRYGQPNVPGFSDSDKMILPTYPDNIKALWFRFIPPTAVVDDLYRRFVIEVSAVPAAQ